MNSVSSSHVLQAKIKRMFASDKEPVSSPCHIAVQKSVARNFDGHTGNVTVCVHVCNGHRAILRERYPDITHRRFKPIFSYSDAAKIRQCGGHANGSMSAHAQVTGVIEEDHSRCRRRINGLEQQRTHEHIRPARFQENRAPVDVMVLAKNLQAFGH